MKAFLLIFSMGWCLQGFSQQEYFVFVQSENRQPFYVRIGEKNISSSAAGHAILSRLKDSSYVFTIGFPQNQFPEQDFTVKLNRKDRGFELKNLGEKGWALFDWQTMEIISAAKPGTGSGGASYTLIKKNDDFARLMAGVVNDTAVLYTVVMPEQKPPVLVAKEPVTTDVAKVETKDEQKKQPEEKTADAIVQENKTEQPADTVRAVSNPVVAKDKDLVKADSAIAKNDDAQKDSAVAKLDPPVKQPALVPETKTPDQVADTAKAEPPLTRAVEKPKPDTDPMKDSVLNPPALPVIAVVREFATDTGYHMLVVDDLKDSIKIFIPADAPQVQNKAVEKPAQQHAVDSAKKITAQQPAEVKTDSSVRITNDISSAAKDSVTDTAPKETKLVMINSDCRSFANTNDVDKLRVKLLGEKDVEDRIGAAKKIFRTKCFSAQQVKALSELFPSDEQKYHFFEAAYPFVSDTGNFKSLVTLLKNPLYVQRFRKLVRLD